MSFTDIALTLMVCGVAVGWMATSLHRAEKRASAAERKILATVRRSFTVGLNIIGGAILLFIVADILIRWRARGA